MGRVRTSAAAGQVNCVEARQNSSLLVLQLSLSMLAGSVVTCRIRDKS